MRRRSIPITWFVLCWTLAFHYESLRANYLNPFFKRELPKLALLFPPAGWIMFYHIDRSYGFAEVYGLHDHTPTLIDPHRIFETKAVGYDNIRRNVLVGVLYRDRAPAFCAFLHRKFPAYDDFLIVHADYPDVAAAPPVVRRQPAYRCQP